MENSERCIKKDGTPVRDAILQREGAFRAYAVGKLPAVAATLPPPKFLPPVGFF